MEKHSGYVAVPTSDLHDSSVKPPAYKPMEAMDLYNTYHLPLSSKPQQNPDFTPHSHNHRGCCLHHHDSSELEQGDSAEHRKCHSARAWRLVFGLMIAAFTFFFIMGTSCVMGMDLSGYSWEEEGVSGLVRRATDNGNNNSNSPFVSHKCEWYFRFVCFGPLLILSIVAV
jgi:hypothetical protein